QHRGRNRYSQRIQSRGKSPCFARGADEVP
ncbi:hypothetical protein AB1N83_013150, partial [Pleurotus pulmonarius]